MAKKMDKAKKETEMIEKRDRDTVNRKKQIKSVLIVLSVVLNIVLLIVSIDAVHVRFHSVTDEDRIWYTAVANALYCAESYEEHNSDEAYYYIIGEVGTLVDLLPYSSFGNEEQKKQFENLYKLVVTCPENMREKGTEMVDIFTMLSEDNEEVFDTIETIYQEILGESGQKEETEPEEKKEKKTKK